MTHTPSAGSADVLATAGRKAARRLLPILIALLFVNYLDRVNVGFAAPHMNPDLGMTATAYGLGVALFFVGYVVVYYVAVPLSTALGGPVSNWLIHHGTSTFGIEGWRFMFAVEGLAAVVLGLVVLRALPSTPREATWLTPQEREALERSGPAREAGEHRSFLAALRSPVTIRLAGIFFLLTFPMFAISFFLPLVTAALPSGDNATALSLVTFVPFTLGAIACWAWSRRSRTRGLRAWRFSAPAVLAGLAVLICSYAGDSFPLLMLGVSITAIGIYAAIPIFWSIAGESLTGAAAAAGLALINTVGSLGGFAAGYFTGWLRDLSGGYQAPFTAMAVCLILSGLLALTTSASRREAVTSISPP